MKLGSRSLLFGVHQVIIHPLLVYIAWVVLYRSLPSFKETVGILVHDWGYWGVEDLKGETGDRHPERGAHLMRKWFGPEWGTFILGHSTFYVARSVQANGMADWMLNGLAEANLAINGIPLPTAPSKLMAPDKYWHCMVPLWFYKLLSVPTGEFRYYRSLQHARQVGPLHEPDLVWWLKLQKVCLEKVLGVYEVDVEGLQWGDKRGGEAKNGGRG